MGLGDPDQWKRVDLSTITGQPCRITVTMEEDFSVKKGYGMGLRGDGTINTAALRTLTHRLDEGVSHYAPRTADDACDLPDRSPGEALRNPRRVAVGPRAVILDCGTSRMSGYTHVLWIAPTAELLLGSHMMQQFGLIMGRVVGIEAYSWEGKELLHVKAPGLDWQDLLREAQDALGDHLARQ